MNKKLLFVVNVDWFFKSHRLPVALSAIKEGYDVHLACTDTGLFDELRELGISCHSVPFSRTGTNVLQELQSFWALCCVLKSVKADLIHTVTIKPAIYVGLLSHVIKVPSLVFAISGLGLVFSSNKLRLKRFAISFLYKLAFKHKNKHIIFQNRSDQHTLLKVLKVAECETSIIDGSGVNLTEFAFQSEPTDKNIKVIMAARLLRDKGVFDFIEAASILAKRSEYQHVQFVLVGAPDFDNPASVTSEQYALWREQGIVSLLGARGNIAELFNDSNIVVLPSYYGEGLPKVLIEAAACGRAVITTETAGCLAAVIPNKTALIIPSKNPTALASAVARLSDDHDLRQQLGKNGRELAEQKFNIDLCVTKHLAIYSSLCPVNTYGPNHD